MQFKDITELKQFIGWAREQKLASVQVGEIAFSFSDVRLLSEPATSSSVETNSATEELDPDMPKYTPNSKSWVDVDQSQEDEDLLFWSANSN